MDLSRFKTNAAKAAEAIVAEADAGMNRMFAEAAIAINPPPLAERREYVPAPAGGELAELRAMATLEGDSALLAEVEAQEKASRETAESVITVDAVEGPGAELLEAVPDTIPAPAPEEPKPRKRRSAVKAAEAQPVAERGALDSATTEQILDELRDRGYSAIYLERAR